ncbi:MAG: NifU family protein [Salibacteraceae bacterium]
MSVDQTLTNEALYLKVVNALDELRPFLHEDGGDLEIVDITKERVLKIQFVGACSNCSMNNMTFKNGVEDAIKRLVPEIERVEPVNFTLN